MKNSANSIHICRRHEAGGFSLIEILSAMAILAVMVTMLTRIFSESERAWQLGVGRAELNSEGRAALTMLANDLQYAVADPVITFAMGTDRDGSASYGFTNSEICFASLQHDSSGDAPRTVREVHYWVREMTDKDDKPLGRYELVRGYFSEAIVGSNYKKHCYHNRDWWKSVANGGAGRPSANGVVAENIAALAFYAPNTNGSTARLYMSAENKPPDYTNRIPEYVDVYLEVMSEHDAEKAGYMDWVAKNRPAWGVKANDVTLFIEKHVRRYTARTFSHNRFGYRDRSPARYR